MGVTLPAQMRVLRFGHTGVLFPFEGTWTERHHLKALSAARRHVEKAYPDDSWTAVKPTFSDEGTYTDDHYIPIYDPYSGPTMSPRLHRRITMTHEGPTHQIEQFSDMVYIELNKRRNP